MTFEPVYQRRWVRLIAVLFGIAAILGVVLGAVSFLGWETPGRVLASWYETGVRVRSSWNAMRDAWNGSDPVPGLEADVARLQAEVAVVNELRSENEFLRRVSDLPARRERTAIDAGIFAYHAGPSSNYMVINRGAHDAVETGGVVTDGNGTFIGIVEDVQLQTARVRTVGSPDVQVTARVRGSDVNGLIRLDALGELVLDLIAKDEQVPEAAVVETSGLDHVPAGLLIGTVRSVDADRTTLFQIIRIDAAFRSSPVTRVLVLNP